MNIYEKIINIQNELKAPKNLYNRFGKYNYRNAESILEGLKPIAKKYGVLFSLASKPIILGEHYFLEGILTAVNAENPEEVFSTSTYCEMDFNHAGMSAEQKMGSCSSYLNKYLLGDLLLLDDNKDPDTDEYHEQTQPERKEEKKSASTPTNAPGAMKEAQNEILKLAKEANVPIDIVLKQTGLVSLDQLDAATYGKLKAALLRKLNGTKSES